MPEVIPRQSARTLVLNARKEILLYRGIAKRSAYAWFTPGGGAFPGESLPVAAAREMREETGQVIPPEAFGPVVAVTSGTWIGDDGQRYLSTDSFFLLNVSELTIDTSGMEDLERSLIDRFRWWPLAELRSTRETVFPCDLAALLDRLLARGAPPTPIVLPWRDFHAASS
ncbi:NUDIX hydrolase [Nonomuraea ceibae]|uniref:NUDIX hydrolase n=1 Tax=Nonomuraea ceibae TaxID=1935170 RepID=UPI001C5E7CA8|nr:NUDIX domain-containing protein [Nonomuraea ceibae]